MSVSLEEKNLFEEIAYAFPAHVNPTCTDIVRFTSACDLDRYEIYKDFGSIQWTKLRLQQLRYHHEAVFFFTPSAYCYFLPAYMRACLQHYSRSGNIPGSLISSLKPPDEGTEARQAFLQKISLLSRRQKKAVVSFLRLMNVRHQSDFPAYDLSKVVSEWENFVDETR